MKRYTVTFGPDAGRFAGLTVPYVVPGAASGRPLYELRSATGYTMEHILRLGDENYTKCDRGEAAYLAGFCSLRKARHEVTWDQYLDEVSFGDLTPAEVPTPGDDEDDQDPTAAAG